MGYQFGIYERDQSKISPSRSPTMMDIAWAAGFLEGEGAFQKHSRSGRVAASQMDSEPLAKLKAIFGGRIIMTGKENGYEGFMWQTSGPRATGIMFTLYSLLSERKQKQICIALGRNSGV